MKLTKFVFSVNLLKNEKFATELLIPNYFTEEDIFIGLNTFYPCYYGIIVYCGKELTSESILQRIVKHQNVNPVKQKMIKKQLDKYIKQINRLTVGDKIKIVKGRNIEIVK
jgi:hypothetical protein